METDRRGDLVSAPHDGTGCTGRTVRLPYNFGDIVYHRVKTERVPGMVTGFQVRERGLLILVMWADDLNEAAHSFFELTTDFESKID